MKNILVIGAGRSASSLIKYFLDNSEKENWNITVADVSLELAKQKTENHSQSMAIEFNVNNDSQRSSEIQKADTVISMLPASMHQTVAKDCLRFKKHLLTASYVSKEIAKLDSEAKNAGIIFMNEIGLDPGIDHMSAMQVIDRIKEEGGELLSFKSYCGGLIAPESNNNPWGYKFTWNPRNVVLAGQGTAQYIENGELKFIPYNRLFTQIETINVDGYGDFEAYANRDSLSYRKPYGLEKIPTMLRGTLRMPGYCQAWNSFVKLGVTDDSYKIDHSEELSFRQFIEAYLPLGHANTKLKLTEFLEEREDSEILKKLEWLGIFEDKKIDLKNASPAQILQDLLEKKWRLEEYDKDLIVMQHVFQFAVGKGQSAKTNLTSHISHLTSSLVVKGEDQVHTAMAKTVGLPAAIATKLILQDKIKSRGVLIPTIKEIYEPVLKELEGFGIVFKEKFS
jgi:saccharopine dehydrogenase-like NADP-dependent oxidoreductase